MNRRGFIGTAAAAAALPSFDADAAGPVAPNWTSLAVAYRVPD